jgi:hypothetical protein
MEYSLKWKLGKGKLNKIWSSWSVGSKKSRKAA